MSTTPKALELAKYLEQTGRNYQDHETAAELRRQHGEIEGLRAQVEALTKEQGRANALLRCASGMMLLMRPQTTEVTSLCRDIDADLANQPREAIEASEEWLNVAAIADAANPTPSPLTRPAVLEGWRELAAQVMDALAEAQEQTNACYPDHVKCYPQWVSHARWCRWHAEMFRTGKPIGNGAGNPKVLEALAAAPQPEAAQKGGE